MTDTPGADPHRNTAVLAFVFGLVGVMACQLTGPIAWYLGASYRRLCAEDGIEPDPLGTVGMALGIVATALLVLTVLIFGGMCGLYFVGIVLAVILGA